MMYRDSLIEYALGTLGALAITSVTFRGLPFRFNLEVQTWIWEPAFRGAGYLRDQYIASFACRIGAGVCAQSEHPH